MVDDDDSDDDDDWAELETLKKDLLSAVAHEIDILVLDAPSNLALNSC